MDILRSKPRKLHKAVEANDWHAASLLIADGAKPNSKTMELVHERNDPDWIEKMNDANSVASQMGSRKLHRAVLREDMAEAKLWLGYIDVRDGATLNLATAKLDSSWVQMLVDAGAVPGEAALGKAIERNLDCVPMMIDAFLASGAKPSDLLVSRACRLTDAPSVKKMFDATGGATPAMMDIAVGTNDAYMVNVLLKAGVVPSEGTLETAVESRPAEWVETFIRAGSKPTADMMDIAVRNRNRHTVNVLLAAKIIPSEKALALAVENKLADWAQVFIKVGAKPTPAMMDTAIRNSDLATIAVLSKAFAALPKPAPAPAENPILRAEQKPPQPRLVLRRPKAG